jgi:ComF family protein
MAPLLAFALELTLAAVAPPRCAACDDPVSLRAVFCAACASTVERWTAGDGRRTVAAFAYGGALAQTIARFKYEQRPDLARPLADLLWSAVGLHANAFAGALVVPVPLHPGRLADRGYNQSALLASRLAKRVGGRFMPLALARTRDDPRQASLDRRARLANARGAFVVRRPRRVEGQSVLLVDDVRTTGATLDACTEVLLRAGAASVRAVVLARA